MGIGRELGVVVSWRMENPGTTQSSGYEGGDVEGLMDIALLRFFPWCTCCFGVEGAGADGRMPMVMPDHYCKSDL